MPNFENSDYRFQPFSCGIDYCLKPLKYDCIDYNSLEFVISTQFYGSKQLWNKLQLSLWALELYKARHGFAN